MARGLRARRAHGNGLDAWPGYVDALSTLLMVIIFVLLVFVLAQAFLGVTLNRQDTALTRATKQLAELSDILSLERGRTAELRESVSGLSAQLRDAQTSRDKLAQQLAGMTTALAAAGVERDTLRTQRDRLQAHVTDLGLQQQSATATVAQLQGALTDETKQAEAAAREAALTAGQLADTRRALAQANTQLTQTQGQLTDTQVQLRTQTEAAAAASQTAAQTAAQLAETQTQLRTQTEASATAGQTAEQTAAELSAARTALAHAQQQLADMRREADALNTTVKADRATIDARLADLAKLAEQTRALEALRDELTRQVEDASVRATTEQQRREALAAQLADEQKLSDSARAQIALLNRQLEEVRAQLRELAAQLDTAQAEAHAKDVQITDLGEKLNVALAQKVEELQNYRSEFFGKLRAVLANRPGVQIVGDRFVLQSEVLFPVGSAEVTAGGQDRIAAIADTIRQIAAEIPPDIKWVLRVDGHADRQPITGGHFTSNWELSAQRAINVVKLLIADGVPADHLAATGFGDTQPVDTADTPDAYAKNRRIELRLTDR